MTETAAPARTVRLVQVGRSPMFHISGLAPTGEYGPSAGSDTYADGSSRGFVSYTAYTACPTLTRAMGSFTSIRSVSTTETIPVGGGRVRRVSTPRELTIPEATAYVTAVQGSLCKRCAAAAATV